MKIEYPFATSTESSLPSLNVQSDQVLYCWLTYFKFLISLKFVMDCSKNQKSYCYKYTTLNEISSFCLQFSKGKNGGIVMTH
jgi:hypothetical protein